jgi:hypothetical protein
MKLSDLEMKAAGNHEMLVLIYEICGIICFKAVILMSAEVCRFCNVSAMQRYMRQLRNLLDFILAAEYAES